ncbi:MAG TPA: PEGA domain-containing protein [Methanoregulaceae archaeon]|mgnify:CR=1 FL=1|nr:MAG: PEGA domain-containing protein [Methanolinea sp.]HON81252.1 PEGA domain-containing protein [Methanoregulaceae archaeon]HPD10142.1 PEGA domain-containing protein [Methanoregulaceae archaeon]HRT15148.1 PEGA domain-containing protein [Methanoregulaceae archaeon]HRU30735.1 PEGA domain-containing protein [Methanoregulaceae archaeon]
MTTIRFLATLALALALCVCCLPAEATLQSFTYRGYVTRIDTESGNLSMLATHQWRCTYENGTASCGWTGITPVPLMGTVPSAAAFSMILSGQVIEASSLGMPGGHWTGIGVLAPIYAEQGYFGTALVGDPGSLPVPLIDGYSVTPVTEPDCHTCTGSVCEAILARITVSRNGETVATASLYPGDTCLYLDQEDQSGVNVTFISGQASAALCPNASPFMTGPQPISIFTVLVIPRSGEVSPFPEAKTGSVSVLSVPSGSRVYLNHELVGSTPITRPGLMPGSYVVRVEKEGYLTWEKSITIHQGSSNILTAGLVSGSGSLSIKSFPWNARILLDGEMKGYTPLLIQNLPVGSHALEIEKPGYQTATKTVQVPAGSIGLVVITLTPEATEE